jgi:hypothetical protein
MDNGRIDEECIKDWQLMAKRLSVGKIGRVLVGPDLDFGGGRSTLKKSDSGYLPKSQIIRPVSARDRENLFGKSNPEFGISLGEPEIGLKSKNQMVFIAKQELLASSLG